MQPGRHYSTREMERGLGPVLRFALRVLMAGLATAVVVSTGSLAMLLNTAPAWLSLMFEPLSLLLIPGLVAGVIASGPHDLDPLVIMDASVVFYFLVFLLLFELRAWQRRKRLRGHRV